VQDQTGEWPPHRVLGKAPPAAILLFPSGRCLLLREPASGSPAGVVPEMGELGGTRALQTPLHARGMPPARGLPAARALWVAQCQSLAGQTSPW